MKTMTKQELRNNIFDLFEEAILNDAYFEKEGKLGILSSLLWVAHEISLNHSVKHSECWKEIQKYINGEKDHD